jgi:biopolymer transport protein ExbB
MTFNVAHIWASMDPLARFIASVLFIMAIASIGVVIERLWAFRRSAATSKRFVVELAPALEAWNLEDALRIARACNGSTLAKLFESVIRRYLDAQRQQGNVSPVQLAKNEAERSKERIGGELRRGMNVLASVGSVAPFVGLLGTVVGIIGAFQGIAASGSGGLGAVSAGIAEALIETAFGLLVAIPAVLFFNYLTARVNKLETALARSLGELLDDMENRDERISRDRIQEAA